MISIELETRVFRGGLVRYSVRNLGRRPVRVVCMLKFHAIYCLRSEEWGPIMDMVLSFLISAGIIAFGVWVVVGTITAGWPLAWTIMGLFAILVGVLSLYGSVRDARTP
jgi:hypothetical protein